MLKVILDVRQKIKMEKKSEETGQKLHIKFKAFPFQDIDTGCFSTNTRKTKNKHLREQC